MDRDTRLEPEDERPEGAGPTDPVVGDDTEGHSFSVIMGVNALSRSKTQSRQQRPDDAELKPITKPFPRMRDQRPG